MLSPFSSRWYASSTGREYLPVARLNVATYSFWLWSLTFTVSRCKYAWTLSVVALAAILSTPTYFVASGVTVKLIVDSPEVATGASTAPSWTAVFVVPAATTQFPSLTTNFVTFPSGVVISALLAPFEIVTGTFVA